MTTFYYAGLSRMESVIADRVKHAGFEQVSRLNDAQVVCTYFATQGSLEDAYLETDGLLKVAQPHTVFVDFSPASPQLIRDLHAIATVNDLVFIEAPLAFNEVAASAHSQRCWFSAEAEGADRGEEVVLAVCDTVERTTQVGSAQLARAAYTIQQSAQLMAAVEASALASGVLAAYGVGVSEEILSSAASTPFTAAAFEAIATQQLSDRYTVEILLGEIAAALAAAEEAGLVLPQAEASMNMLEMLAVIGGSDLSPAAAALMYDPTEEGAKNSEAAGLDWSRTQQVLGSEYTAGEGDTYQIEDDYDNDEFDDYDDGAFDETGSDQFGQGFSMSSTAFSDGISR